MSGLTGSPEDISSERGSLLCGGRWIARGESCEVLRVAPSQYWPHLLQYGLSGFSISWPQCKQVKADELPIFPSQQKTSQQIAGYLYYCKCVKKRRQYLQEEVAKK